MADFYGEVQITSTTHNDGHFDIFMLDEHRNAEKIFVNNITTIDKNSILLVVTNKNYIINYNLNYANSL